MEEQKKKKTYRKFPKGMSVQEKRRIQYRGRERRRRTKALEVLGGRCVRCGFADPRALHIDHVKGGANSERNQHKRQGKNYSWHMIKRILQGDTVGLQLLCANCNFIKRAENKEFHFTAGYEEWEREYGSNFNELVASTRAPKLRTDQGSDAGEVVARPDLTCDICGSELLVSEHGYYCPEDPRCSGLPGQHVPWEAE